MRSKKLIIRFLFCLSFIAIVFYVRSYHGEWINNAQVEWQYLKNEKGTIYLAMDVYSPSGIKIDSILSDGRNITDSWRLLNYPDWYKGKEHFKKLGEFQEVLHPYLPYNKDFNVLCTNGWYTFLYEWSSDSSVLIPGENSIKIKYQNIGTKNYYNARRVSGIKIVSNIFKATTDSPVIDFQLLYPFSFYKFTDKNNPRINLDNLVSNPDFPGYILKDLDRKDYVIYVEDDRGGIIDSVKGFVRWDNERAYQVYSKAHGAGVYQASGSVIDFAVLFRHVVATLFMVYFVLICRYMGLAFVKWRGIVLDSYADKLIIPVFLGIIFLTFLFFVIGILKLLYFPILFAILLLILFFGFRYKDITELKAALCKEFDTIKKTPWRIVFLVMLLGMLFYHLSYCFVPATYLDGSGDIVNSYLPNLNDYIISHSFDAPIYNSTYGIIPQATDVLRTVVKIFIGEPGVYLLSFVYLLLAIGGIYLIGKKMFRIDNMLIYLAILMLLSQDLFTKAIHLGKWHIAVLSFLLIALYSMHFSNHKQRYILPALFFSFLSSQYNYFVVLALVYFIFLISYDFYHYRTIKNPVFSLHAKSFILFCLLSSIFYLKLILEVGTCLPPGITPPWIADFFLIFNHNNDFYKYIDNNYIRHFYNHTGNSDFGQYVPSMSEIIKLMIKSINDNLSFSFILLFLPLLKWKNKYLILYMVEIITLLLLFSTLFYTCKNTRLIVYYIYPIIILQFNTINVLILKFKNKLCYFLSSKIFKVSIVLLLSFVIIFDVNTLDIKFRSLKFLRKVARINICWHINSREWYFSAVLPVFWGIQSKYQYLRKTPRDGAMHRISRGGAERYFDHAMLIRQYSDITDTILIVPVRFHSDTMRHITARHALGSVIYQKDITQIMADLKRLNINYLSTIPIPYGDYNPFYTPIFEEDTFYRYFKLLFSDNGSRFYKIIHDGSNTEYTPSPYDVNGLPFVPMIKGSEI